MPIAGTVCIKYLPKTVKRCVLEAISAGYRFH